MIFYLNLSHLIVTSDCEPVCCTLHKLDIRQIRQTNRLPNFNFNTFVIVWTLSYIVWESCRMSYWYKRKSKFSPPNLKLLTTLLLYRPGRHRPSGTQTQCMQLCDTLQGKPHDDDKKGDQKIHTESRDSGIWLTRWRYCDVTGYDITEDTYYLISSQPVYKPLSYLCIWVKAFSVHAHQSFDVRSVTCPPYISRKTNNSNR